jgi:WD40 repeat protein
MALRRGIGLALLLLAVAFPLCVLAEESALWSQADARGIGAVQSLQFATWDGTLYMGAAFTSPNEVRIYRMGQNATEVGTLSTVGVPTIALSSSGDLAIAEVADNSAYYSVTVWNLPTQTTQSYSTVVPAATMLLGVAFTGGGVVAVYGLLGEQYRQAIFWATGDTAVSTMPATLSSSRWYPRGDVSMNASATALGVSDNTGVYTWHPGSKACNFYQLPDVALLDMNPAGNLIAAFSAGDHALVMLDAPSGTELWRQPLWQCLSVAFSVDGSLVAADTPDGVVSVFAAQSGNLIGSIDYSSRGSAYSSSSAVALSYGGEWIATVFDDHQVLFWHKE